MKCLLIQPGAYGDIILCAPIAYHYYTSGYQIFWPARNKFKTTIENLGYASFIEIDENILHEDWLRSDVIKCLKHLSENKYDIVLNLADRGPNRTQQLPSENFEECKYRLSNLPLSYKYNLLWQRNLDKEKELIDIINPPKEYNFIVVEDSLNQRSEIPKEALELPIIEPKIIDNFTIFDWYLIIKNASNIFCVESAFHQFIDGCKDFIQPKFLLKRPCIPNGFRFTHSPSWDKKYIKETKVIG